MVTPSLLTEFYEENEKQARADIRYLQADMGEMQTVRERFADDWQIEELIRGIIFEEVQTINLLKEEIENVREARKELGKL